METDSRLKLRPPRALPASRPTVLGARVTGTLLSQLCHIQLLTSGFTPVLNIPSTLPRTP